MTNMAIEKLQQNRESLLQYVPAHVGKERFFRIAIGTIRQNPKLMQCDAMSLISAVTEAAKLGLEIGGNLNQSWLIPYGRECKLIIGYGGLLDLAKRSGDVVAVTCEIVRERDHFRRTQDSIEHEWDPFATDRGDVIGCYCIVYLKGGVRQYETMSKDEVEAIRARSRAGHAGPWVDDWSEMARKTVLRRALKKTRLSPEAQDAISRDDEAQFVQSRVVETKLGNKAVLEYLQEKSDDDGAADSGGDGGGVRDRDPDGGAVPESDEPQAQKRAPQGKGGGKATKAGARAPKTADDLEFEGNAKSEEEPNPFN